MFCGFVINFGYLKISPEKPDFSKSGVHGVNGPQGSCLASILWYCGTSFGIYFGMQFVIFM